jgi:hypothetical protein
MSGAAAKKSTVLNDAVMAAATPKSKTKAKTDDALNAKITENPFYNVLFAADKSLAEKQTAVTEMMTSTLDSKQDRARVKAYDDFREWLSAQQTTLAEQVISLSNVDSMAELQSVLKEMNMDLLSFEEKMNPIMEIIESIHYLRTNDLIGDTFKEIKEDQEREEGIRQEIHDKKSDIVRMKREIDELKDKKAQASTERSYFGLGGLTKTAVAAVDRADEDIADKTKEINAIETEISSLNESLAPQGIDESEVALHKARLRELVDMSKEENRDRIIQLRDSASKFISTARDRTGSLRGQFEQLSGQIGGVEDSNQNMLKVYAVLNEGMKDAAEKNSAIRQDLDVQDEDESMVQKMTREEQLRSLDTHVGHLSRSQGETMAAYGDLNQQAIRVHTMRSSTDQQIDTARQINTQGVAATADRLATVLTAVSAAALGEASAAAQDTLGRMRQSTNDISSREVIRVAMGVSGINDQLETVFQELEEIREVQQAATGIVRNGMTEMTERMQQLKETAALAKEDLNNHIASASMAAGEAGDSSSTEAPVVTGFPGV